jgi:hypothetical protein
MQPIAQLQEFRHKVKTWLDLTEEIAPVFGQLGGVGAAGMTIPTRPVTRTTTGTNGGSIVPKLVKEFVATSPGATAPDIASYVSLHGGGIVAKTALQNTLARMRKKHLLRARGKPGSMKYFLPGS